ncbi:MAG: elongation factor G [Lewinellaceae bacterium]|nr:elongation factor G [Saprospiraceae bacterium]MCB9339675.1 elongation factor G [Lewinellaceae bacterium]
MNYDTSNIRNVVLLGHPGCGKTSFAETMLFETGGISRRGSVQEQNTVSDYTDLEHERGNSIFSTLMHDDWRGNKINVLDTPGFDDFIGEVVSSLKVSATALVLLNAKSGVEVGTELLWEYVEKFETPSIFVVNQLDHEKADYDSTVDQATARFGKILPIQYPLNPGSGFNTIVDALRMTMYVFPPGGGKPEKKPIPDSEKERAMEMHNAIVEAAAENDEELMERFFDKGTLSEEDLAYGLRIAIANRTAYPLFCCSALQNMGSGRIMGFINDVCPSPAERMEVKLEGGGTLKCDASGDTTIFIFKTHNEPRVGSISYFKVYSGSLKAGDELVNADNRHTERFGQLYISNGKNREPVEELKAGDLGCTVKLKSSHTNQTLNKKGVDRKIDPIHFPNSRIEVAVHPPSKNDMEKLMKALHSISEEDPTLIIEQSKSLKQTLLYGQGQLHLDLVKHRVESEFGVGMEFEKPRIPYRETIMRESNEMYRHKKQSGGAGQFAEVHMRIEPYHEGMPEPTGLTVRNKEIDELPWGGHLAFYWCIVGGSIDARFSNAIKKGVLQKMEEGPLTGSNCQDIRVSIYDGKMHPVDSNDMAFMLASINAFKQNFSKANPQLLEPIYDVEILCSDEVMGDVMGDLQTRRAIIVGMGAEGHYQKIIAKVPLAELYQYSSTLRSISQGRAKFNRKFAEYAPVPGDIQQKLIEAHKSEQQDED